MKEKEIPVGRYVEHCGEILRKTAPFTYHILESPNPNHVNQTVHFQPYYELELAPVYNYLTGLFICGDIGGMKSHYDRPYAIVKAPSGKIATDIYNCYFKCEYYYGSVISQLEEDKPIGFILSEEKMENFDSKDLSVLY